MPAADRAVQPVDEFEGILADVFRQAGWRVQRALRVGDMVADFLVRAGRKKYLTTLRSLLKAAVIG